MVVVFVDELSIILVICSF